MMKTNDNDGDVDGNDDGVNDENDDDDGRWWSLPSLSPCLHDSPHHHY